EKRAMTRLPDQANVGASASLRSKRPSVRTPLTNESPSRSASPAVLSSPRALRLAPRTALQPIPPSDPMNSAIHHVDTGLSIFLAICLGAHVNECTAFTSTYIL